MSSDFWPSVMLLLPSPYLHRGAKAVKLLPPTFCSVLVCLSIA